MEDILQPGIVFTLGKTVGEEDTASHYGSGLIPVFATPAMIGLMEATAQQSVQPLLPDGYITLGIEIHMVHKKATLVGKRVHCTSSLDRVEGKLLTFSISVRDEGEEVGTAMHKRYIVNAEGFMQKLHTDLTK